MKLFTKVQRFWAILSLLIMLVGLLGLVDAFVSCFSTLNHEPLFGDIEFYGPVVAALGFWGYTAVCIARKRQALQVP